MPTEAIASVGTRLHPRIEAGPPLRCMARSFERNVLDRVLVEETAFRLRSDPGLIEKDWHATRALAVLAALDHRGGVPAFGGGTSLSKGWQLIKRFSEDIDFKVALPAAPSRDRTKLERSAYREHVLAALVAADFVLAGEPTIVRHLHDLAALKASLAASDVFTGLVQRAMASDQGRGGETRMASDPAALFADMLT